MNRKMAKILSALLIAMAIAVTQIPVSDVEAVAPASDFQMEGNKLLKYTGTAEVVSIPDNVKEIGEEAFAGNDNLVKVTIGGQVEKVGYRAFADCDNLRTIQVGDSVEELETAAFSNNRELRNVTLGAGLKKIGSGVFAGCSQLSELSLSENNSYLAYSDGILYDDEKKILFALMPDYEKEAFTVPETVEEINAYAFWGNPYLKHVTLDSNLSSIPAYAFSNCMNLDSVTIPLPVRSIEAKAFEDCVSLSTVTLPDSMNNIHATAFDGCSHVEFEATPGTYGAEYAALRKASEVERIEYEDVQDSQVISADEITGDTEQNQTPENETNETEVTPRPEDTETMPPESPTTINGSSGSGRLLGESSIVAGRAVVFIDNARPAAGSNEKKQKIDLGVESEDSDSPAETVEAIGNILSDNAEKGKDFPKYTIAGNKIASQAYYQDNTLAEYEIPEGITEIGDFAFSRSGLNSIVIPEGVEKIGYGAFYHCDSLTSVTIPDSVKEIAANAFVNTPWLDAERGNASSDFVIAGDGILLSYTGTDSVVNIPDGVKQIGAEVFKDHMGITAVNIPDSVTVIGEAAFSGCKNLKTVNGGGQLTKVGDRAFFNCPLSQIVVPAAMKEIGLGAYASSGGTDTVVFEGEELPVLTIGDNAGRLFNEEARTYAFGNCKTAIVSNLVSGFEGTVLESGKFGFHGIICNETGDVLGDLTQGVSKAASDGISLQINSKVIASGRENAMATLAGNENDFVLAIRDSDDAAARIAQSYGEIYGGREPAGLLGFDITLYDSTGQIPITKLGKQYVTVQIPKPESVSTEGLHVVTLDSDGQLEAVEYRIVNLEDGDYIQFTAHHFSPYGIYQYSGINGQGVVANGKVFVSMAGNKDDTPDTGDGIHPKWFLAMGLLAAAVALFFYRGKHISVRKK
ncbi:MAG: leucine-rich repeat domain-containing protein [Lachnospiraceae bacterium]|nr:leucine-rich repeat domain-containing protein [Lachnospiraceae bacterium]